MYSGGRTKYKWYRCIQWKFDYHGADGSPKCKGTAFYWCTIPREAFNIEHHLIDVVWWTVISWQEQHLACIAALSCNVVETDVGSRAAGIVHRNKKIKYKSEEYKKIYESYIPYSGLFSLRFIFRTTEESWKLHHLTFLLLLKIISNFKIYPPKFVSSTWD